MLSACGGGGGTDSNTAPKATDQSVSTGENTPLDITLTGNDDDGDSLSFTVKGDPANGTLSGTVPDLTYTPDADFTGDDSFTFTVGDGSATSAQATVSITVTPLYAIGGTVTGMVNSGLTLENNEADSLDVAGVSFEFPTQLSDASAYEVTVAAPPEQQLCQVANASGTVAAADVNDVDVLCRSWRTAAPIETDSGDAGAPQIAFDGNGNAMAVWIQNDGSFDRVWANTWSADSGWGTATVISGSTGDAETPQVVFDSNGDARAVWTQLSTYTNLWVNRYQPGTGWGTAGFIEYNDGNATDPQIAADSAGNLMIVWEQDEPPPTTPNPTNIWAIYYLSGSGWGTAEKIETDGGSAQVPKIAFDSDGNAIAVWSQYNGSTEFDIRANIYASGGTWGTPEDIESTDAGNSFNPQIVIDSSDVATVVWSSNDGTRDNIWATSYTAASGWGADELLETDNAGSAFNPQIAVDSADNLIAVWRQHDGTGYNIWANTATPDDGWGTAELVETTDSSASTPQVAFDGDGNAIAVWTTFSIWANTWSPGDGWSTEGLIETDETGSATVPQVGFDHVGNAIAVWAQDDGTRTNIEANSFE
ncbi:hypothetical protein GCM10007392_22480 [Saccharospirillum salsuginis]|uniref:GH16 domain-containing protein n=1 Tax=Saccharospirillum salsuginis TaxID=418750 RepID=A0A918K9B0_9GAMM|nr:hypothetical protein GCM10007392_22480 [Saccharospirillum salsuginis]